MPTRDEYMSALKKAGDAEDSTAAKALASKIHEIDSGQPVAPAAAAGSAPAPEVQDASAPLSSDARAFRTDIHGVQMPTEGEGGPVEQFLGGAKHHWDRAAMGLKTLFPMSIQNLSDKADEALTGKKQLTPELLQRGAAYEKETGPLSTIGGVGTDVAIGAGTGAASKAGVAADMAAQGLLNYATTPGNTEERSDAAATGAGAALGGRVLTRALGGPLRPAITPEAKALIDRDIYPTPGGMVSGTGSGGFAKAARSVEDKSTSLPVLGDIIQNAKLRAVKAYNKTEINDALAPLGAKIQLAGTDGLERAHSIVDKTLDAVTSEIKIPANVGRPTMDHVLADIRNNPRIDASHEAAVNKLVAIKIDPRLQSGVVNGQVARDVDAYIGDLAKKTKDEVLQDAFYDIQKAWRNSMVGSTPSSKKILADATESFNKLRTLQTSTKESPYGLFSPRSMQKAGGSSDLGTAASTVLADTVPDSGTAGRTMLGTAAKSLAAAAAGGTAVLHPTLGAGAAAIGGGIATAYSKPGLAYLAKGIRPVTDSFYNLLPAKIQQQLSRMKPQDAENALRVLSTQMMRSSANSMGEQNAP